MRSQVWQTFSLLYHYPAFGRLWVGRSISRFGDAITLIALPWFGRWWYPAGVCPATSVIAFSALACILVGLSGLLSPTFRGLSLPSADSGSYATVVIDSLCAMDLHGSGMIDISPRFLTAFSSALELFE